ncbi:TetR/AcrR family transcriptional regulator [Vibrio sp. 99-70-13A1]|uniref:TetR/AcrR family transcriptional regulator n=1 Tax=Vibrio sp. 99-70-13A1 TaxID=2607601 RepID=UPI001493BD3D|nr:TetR/AcrR family transcriptional regulator [Vibrio sp. 99-70-13A1]NOH99183.1 TetR/AcrR family transcriptional regulator [Vibrio sp. 99-70-13A1]
MTEKKQGRRSAKDAEETRFQIMTVAAEMFCDLGYERVSLRNISEKAGVSHSLIRHHFGSKEKIWHAISDCLHVYFQSYISKIMQELPKNITPNISIYLFAMRLFTNMIHSRRPIQLLSDSVRQTDNLVDYFIDNVGDLEYEINMLADHYNEANPDNLINIFEIKWQMIMYANGAVCLTPFMESTWNEGDMKTTPEDALMKHWEMFNSQMVSKFRIDDEWVLKPNSLEELIYEVPCVWKCNHDQH